MDVSSLGLQSVIFLPLTRTFLQEPQGISIAVHVMCVAVVMAGVLGAVGGAGSLEFPPWLPRHME